MEAKDDLGRRVSERRKLHGMSLRTLAAQSGLSPSFLSQLERGRTDASIASLHKIASALSTSVSELLDPNPRNTRGVQRAEGQPSTQISDGSSKFFISPPLMKNVEIYIGRFAVGGASGEKPHAHDASQEFLIVLSGRVLLELGDESYTLDKHDSIEYPSSVPHRVQNIGSTDAEVMWVQSPPSPSFPPGQSAPAPAA